MTMVLLPSTTFQQLPQILEDVSPPVTQSSCGRQPSVRHSPGHLLPQPAVLAPRCSCHLWQQLKAKTTQARGKPTGSKPGGLKLQHKSDKNTPVCETASSKEKSTGFQWAEGPKRAQQVFFPSSNFLCFARTSKRITWHLGSREWGNLLQPSCLPGALVGLASKRKSGRYWDNSPCLMDIGKSWNKVKMGFKWYTTPVQAQYAWGNFSLLGKAFRSTSEEVKHWWMQWPRFLKNLENRKDTNDKRKPNHSNRV